MLDCSLVTPADLCSKTSYEYATFKFVISQVAIDGVTQFKTIISRSGQIRNDTKKITANISVFAGALR